MQKVFISLNCHVLFFFLYDPGLKRRKYGTSGVLIQNRKKEKYKHDKGEIEKRGKRNRKARKENMGWVGY